MTEQMSIEAIERKRLADEATAKYMKEQEDETERRRIENRTHRSKVDAAVELSLRGLCIGDDAAHEVAMALAQGKIPRVTINY